MSLSTAAVTRYAGRCKISMQYSYHAQDSNQTEASYLPPIFNIPKFVFVNIFKCFIWKMCIICNTVTILSQKNVQFVQQHHVSPHQLAVTIKLAAHSQCCNSRYLQMQFYHHAALLSPIPDDDTDTFNTQHPSRDIGVRVTSRLMVGQSGVLMSLCKCYCLG